ncbi:TauD/TfdA dioxygenase family protein [Streptomyces hainanensis]|uniref:Taurine dioxygenase n=1 Tax=Streptomyces hainanensis TaxID=402648 RepID=A0A4R4T8P4_9ACTN|nr:TauD/TfdA family dioxygenase [Streptomyces hainanensis]TDC71432.1 taurine dioxygenase [Streptomyces hainanensis]
MTVTDTTTDTVPAALALTALGPRFGARIDALDLSAATDAQLAAVRAALVAHKVLFFPEQRLDPDSQVALGRRLGELTASHPVVPGIDEDHPEIYALDAADNGFADVWHTDVTFVRRPPLGSILRAVQVPPAGGDTSWADGQLAYESLSPPVRDLADRLTAVHDGSREFGYYLAQRRGGEGNEWDGERYRGLDPVEHPVVRVHPETGRRSLFVNPGFTSHLVGLSDAESRGVLDLLYAHLTKPEHIIRHSWRAGDVAMWDNRATLHYANRDYGDFRRVMHRVTLRGDIPSGPATPPTP